MGRVAAPEGPQLVTPLCAVARLASRAPAGSVGIARGYANMH